MHTFASRFAWALHLLDIQPNDRLLEIGCGNGTFASSITPLLKKGKLTALDRSSAQITKAIARNKDQISKRKALFAEGDIRTTRIAGKPFDKIFAINVSTFWLAPATSLPPITKSLNPDGLFYIIYEPAGANARSLAIKAADLLSQYGFTILHHIIQPLPASEAFALIARLTPA